MKTEPVPIYDSVVADTGIDPFAPPATAPLPQQPRRATKRKEPK